MVARECPLTVITGAAGSIGRATARRLLSSGHDLVLLDRNATGLAEARAQILTDSKQLVLSLDVDVVDRSAVMEALEETGRSRGPITGLFSNAGIGRWGAVHELSLDDWQIVMDTNIDGTVNVCQAALPFMVANGGGAIVIMSSDLAIIGRANYSSYCAAKTALYGLTKALALEFAPDIRVNAVGPGPIDTPHLRSGRMGSTWEVAEKRYIAGIPAGRLGLPEDIAPVVEFLLSERSSHMTGQMIQPNGGQVMW